MSRGKSVIVYMILAVFPILGAQLLRLFEVDSPAKEVSSLELLSALLGFLLLLTALIGTILLIRHNMRPMSRGDISEWEIVRRQGKRAFVRNALLKGIAFGLLAVSWPLVSEYSRAKSFGPMVHSFWMYLALIMTCVVGASYAAIRIWNANEREISKGRQPQ